MRQNSLRLELKQLLQMRKEFGEKAKTILEAMESNPEPVD